MEPKKILMLAGVFLEAGEVVVDDRLVTASFWPIGHERIRKSPKGVDMRNES